MKSLEELLSTIERCNACSLMGENESIGISYVPVLPKPNAKVVFVGRDPSPRTAKLVGLRGGRSAFINEIFNIADRANVAEDQFYITDLCKCHWRTSVGKPLPNTESRSPKLDSAFAYTCMNQWLVREVEIMKPRLIVAFGEEVYQLLRPLIVDPAPPPTMFSAKADKSIVDAEYWFVYNGTLSLKIGSKVWPLAVLRHPGNSGRLPKASSSTDQRLQFHQRATQQVIALLKDACT